MPFFDIDQIFFTLWGYPMSYLEFFGSLAGAIAVWLSARANIWSWPIGIINTVLLCFLFFQSQLYPDVFLNIFFTITNIMGWWRWSHPEKEEEDRKKELKVSYLPAKQLIIFSIVGGVGTFVSGQLASHLHVWLPGIFSQPSAFPYVDSFVTVLSVIATFWMIQKKVECWMLWIIIDAVATGVYFVKGLKLLGLEYLVFCFIAAFGLWNWMKEYRLYSYFIKKICFYGPESTGKTVMIQKIAAEYHTEFVPEVAREIISSNSFTDEDSVKIGRAQNERVMQKIPTANRILLCDTDVITTEVYSLRYNGRIPEELMHLEKEVTYDLYFLFDIDFPWVADGMRDLSNEREAMFAMFRDALVTRKIPFVLVRGSFEERERIVRAEIERILG